MRDVLESCTLYLTIIINQKLYKSVISVVIQSNIGAQNDIKSKVFHC